MKTLLKLILVATCFTACHNSSSPDENADFVKDSLLAVPTDRVTVHNEWLASIRNISHNLDSITGKKETIFFKMRNRNEFPPLIFKEINTEIVRLNNLLKKNEKEIKELNNKLTAADTLNKSLSDSIAALNQKLTGQQEELMGLYDFISEFDAEFHSLEAALYTLYAQNAIQSSAIIKRTVQANAAYYCIGSFNELKKKNIVSKDKRLLGWKDPALNSEMTPAAFTKIDIQKQKTFDLNTKHARLLTVHSTTSYKFEKDKKKVKRLIITDPAEFWRISKYLVVQTD